MYLKRLYLHNRAWFLVVLLFITGQLFINYKQGVVCTPFFHYGMYSAVISPGGHYLVPEIFVNGTRLATKDFSPQQWDRIIQPVVLFNTQQTWNSNLFQKDIHRILSFTDAAHFTHSITQQEFSNWYQLQLEDITGKKVNDFSIVFAHYSYNGTSFTPSMQ